MNQEKISQWLASCNDLKKEKRFWQQLPTDLQTELEPIRQKIINDQKKLEETKSKLEQTKAQMKFYQEAINSLPNPIFIKNEQAKFLFFNKEYEKKFGMKKEKFLGKTVKDLEYLPLKDRKKYQKEDLQKIKDLTTVHYEKTFLFSDQKVHDSLYWSAGFLVPQTQEKGLIGEIVDISHEKELSKNLKLSMDKLTEANKEIAQISRTDKLTGLANRYALEEPLPAMLSVSKRHNLPFTILMADLDHFKMVNDTYGHLAGDQVLQKFAKILQENCRSEDLAVRIGGEEFLILLPLSDLTQAKLVAEKICQITRKKSLLPKKKKITVSIGITQYKNGESQEHLLKRVDKALYQAKENGRDQVQIK